MAEWLADRLDGVPMDDRLRYVTTTGAVVSEPLSFDRPVGAVVAGRGAR
jgi:hypothetical protein